MKNIIYFKGSDKNIDQMPWLFRFKLNNENLYKYDINLLDIKVEFINFWVNKMTDIGLKKKKKDNTKTDNFAIMSTLENDDDLYIHIRFNFINANIESILDIFNMIMTKFIIKGMDGITDVDDLKLENVLSYDKYGNIVNKEEYVIYTSGVNFEELFLIEELDIEKMICNDIHLVYTYFGIEAARKVIIKEIDKVYNSQGSNMNTEHISLLADQMTILGSITSIDRHGINRITSDPLSKASFEKQVELLLNSALFNEVDNLNSVSSRIMMG
jgi:DNA-directed RNA polymerase beta' subunit